MMTRRSASVERRRTKASLPWQSASGVKSLSLVRVDKEFFAGCPFDVDRDVGGIERFGQRHDFGVVARKSRLQLVDNALAQLMCAGLPDLRQERHQQPAPEAPSGAEGTGDLGRSRIERAVDIDLL